MTAASFNRLKSETSPYLRQHQDNPVHWWPWCDDAFAAAVREDKPVLLSVGYAACHWCHVMAHESFENQAIAEQMNRLFVCIKVDREERPDVDAIYMKALHLLGEQGGWPLTMFLTPDRKPIWGGTYFPPAPRYGRPGFGQILENVARVWRDARADILAQGGQLAAALVAQQHERLRDGLSVDMVDGACAHLLDYVDPIHGGLKGAPKFPMPFVWELVWRAWKRTGDRRFHDAVVTLLDRACQGGVYDHLGGGFARYSTDEAWLVPHFEKMLYDNALMLDLMAEVSKDTRNPLLLQRAEDIIAWLDREMTGENGGYAAALDADSDGEEGKFYVWTKTEIDTALGDHAVLFAEAYDVTPAGNWEGRVVLNRNASRGRAFSPDEEQRLAHARRRLLAVREIRIRPGRDDKVLADWNGMMVATLVACAVAFDRPAWLTRARSVFDAVCATMLWRDARGRERLCHSLCGGRALPIDLLDDYAQMIRAALALFEATVDAGYLARAETWSALTRDLFWDSAGGGFFFTPSGANDVIVRTRTAHDSATPSGNGVMVANFARLFHLTGRDDYRQAAEAIIAAFEVEAIKAFPHGAALLSGFDLLVSAVLVVIVGPMDDLRVTEMRRAMAAVSAPNLIVQVIGSGDVLAGTHPAAGKAQIDGRVTAYVCRGNTCSPPVTSPHELAKLLLPSEK
ncbi:MAG: thioredoxin domain-containing protein [Alphaproteobacteria bacterium]|nr:thioredoxin domain-containing protein [Alphaproteobacteria bacterium]